MRVERIITGVKTLGPGNRLVIFTNGCRKRCPGCVSQRLQKFDKRTEIDVIEAIKEFSLANVDGVTISGGEPFIQEKELAKLVRYFNDQSIDDILIYSGYTLKQLQNKNNLDINYVLDNIGVLIDGPYIQDKNDNTGNLKGSSNQSIIFIREGLKEKYDNYFKIERSCQEFTVGNIKIGIGIPTSEYINDFKKE